jgi:hypothetical protein
VQRPAAPGQRQEQLRLAGKSGPMLLHETGACHRTSVETTLV